MKIASSMLVMAGLVCLLSTGCGMKVMAKGRVVDAETGKPIEGAAVAVKWVNEKFALPGLGSNRKYYGTTEILSDAQGGFTIPRYIGILNRYFMGVYKEGYVCWSSEIDFNPYGKMYEETFRKRKYSVGNGMIIKLKPMPDEISAEQQERHAHFTSDVQTFLSTSGYGLFDNAIKYEKELHRQILRRNFKEK